MTYHLDPPPDPALDAWQRFALRRVTQAVQDAVLGVQGELDMDAADLADAQAWQNWLDAQAAQYGAWVYAWQPSMQEARRWLLSEEARELLDFCGYDAAHAEIRGWVMRGCPVDALVLRLLKQEEE